MSKVFGAALVGWPFAGLAWLAGKEVFAALGVTVVVMGSILYGVYLLTPDAK